MAEPEYSMTAPVPPPMPMWAIRARMMSLAPTPVFKVPSTRTRNEVGGALQETLGGQHIFHFAGADSECEGSECSMSGSVAIAADYGHAGLGCALVRGR